MLSPDIEIAALDGRHMQNWWKLAMPPNLSETLSYLLVVLDQGTPIHALKANTGAIPLDEVDFRGTGKASLHGLKRKHEVDAVIVLERESLSDIAAVVDTKVRLSDDYVSQGIHLWQALRESQGIWSEPPLLDLIPPLRAQALQKTLNLLVPDKSTLAAYVIDEKEGRVHCSGIALKEEGAFTLATMHPVIEDLVSERELVRNWRTNYTKVNQSLTSRLARPSISIFIEREAVARILSGPADQLARELKQGNLVISPAPAWLQGLLGGAAAIAVASSGAKQMARFLPKGARSMAGSLAGVAKNRMKNSSVNPFSMLGFDPVQLLGQLRKFYSS